MKMEWRGKQISNQLHDGIMSVMQTGMGVIIEEADREVPIDEGTLLRSGHVVAKPSTSEVYGAYDTPYAVRLHEHPEYKFKHGRKGQWLLRSWRKNKAKVHKWIGVEVKRILA